jgi:1D-myo-inositol 3-kinase
MNYAVIWRWRPVYMRVLCVGHVTIDGDEPHSILGGSAYYGALVYQALGADSGLATAFGGDLSVQKNVEELLFHASIGQHTTRFTNVYDDHGTRQQVLHALAPDVILPNTIPPGDILHLAPVFGECSLADIENMGRFRLCALNIQGFLRACEPKNGGSRAESHGAVIPRVWIPGRHELAHIDAVFLSEDDLVGQHDLLTHLRDSVPWVVCTAGERGATLYGPSGIIKVGSYPARVVDPTGAGDAFAAGFMYAFAHGAEPEVAMLTGSAVASVIIEGRGTATVGRIGAVHSARMVTIPVLD